MANPNFSATRTLAVFSGAVLQLGRRPRVWISALPQGSRSTFESSAVACAGGSCQRWRQRSEKPPQPQRRAPPKATKSEWKGELQQLLEYKGYASVRAALGLCGHPTGCQQVAARAEARYVKVIPHNPLSMGAPKRSMLVNISWP